MLRWLDRISYPILIAVAIFMLLAPFQPMPHLLEKLIMIKNGTLHRPIDIFDLIYHLLPALLLAVKFVRDRRRHDSDHPVHHR